MLARPDSLVDLSMPHDGTQGDLLHELPQHWEVNPGMLLPTLFPQVPAKTLCSSLAGEICSFSFLPHQLLFQQMEMKTPVRFSSCRMSSVEDIDGLAVFEHGFTELLVYMEQISGELPSSCGSPNPARLPKCNTVWEQLQSNPLQALQVLTPHFFYMGNKWTNKTKSPPFAFS